MILRPTLLGWVAAIAALLAAGPVPASADDCLSPREVRAAVSSGQAKRLSSVARAVGGDIVDAQLCDDGGALVYRLTVMTQGGRIMTILVDARSGKIVGR